MKMKRRVPLMTKGNNTTCMPSLSLSYPLSFEALFFRRRRRLGMTAQTAQSLEGRSLFLCWDFANDEEPEEGFRKEF